ncbi:HNH endonuclease [Alkalicoccobacillus gibsonii]|uniref:HNH endonuclease n=1 Tax=Alkalicoccobacillus gibsonii TaxID=79881 RepID=A0ABU9VEI7_9BACI
MKDFYESLDKAHRDRLLDLYKDGIVESLQSKDRQLYYQIKKTVLERKENKSKSQKNLISEYIEELGFEYYRGYKHRSLKYILKEIENRFPDKVILGGVRHGLGDLYYPLYRYCNNIDPNEIYKTPKEILEKEGYLIEKSFEKGERKSAVINKIKKNKIVSIEQLPPLKRYKQNFSKVFNSYDDLTISKIVYSWCNNGDTHKEMDKVYLNSPVKNGGIYNSTKILYELGLSGNFKGLFKNQSIDEILNIISENIYYSNLKYYLELYRDGVLDINNKSINEEEDEFYSDGAIQIYTLTRYERKSVNRLAAIEHHGLRCKVCDLNFEEEYGELGSGFIEVHHVEQLSERKSASKINPKDDLITVCSNCHRMLHRRDKTLSIKDLKKIYQSKMIK